MPGFTFNIGYELIPLLMCSVRTLHSQYWLCSGSSQLCPPTSLLYGCWTIQILGVVATASGKMGPEDIPPVGCDSALWPGLGGSPALGLAELM